MDGQRFDDLARLIGSGASRRRVLKVLAGGLGSLWLGNRSTLAQCANPEACQADDECCEGFTCDTSTLVCTEDLPEPCGFVGSPCEGDADCCNSPCVGNVCQCPELGSACTDGLQCCSPVDCILGECAFCRERGEICTDNAECCNQSCFQGLCHVEGQCLPSGSHCRADFQCCDGLCNHNGICMGCFVRPCTGDTDCCVGDVCAGGGICRPPCNALGESCVNDADCCRYLGHTCQDNVCVVPPRCAFEGESCPNGDECCQGRECKNGTCCLSSGGGCGGPSDCCSGDCFREAPTDSEGYCVDCREVGALCESGDTCCSGLCIEGICTPCVDDESCAGNAICCAGACRQIACCMDDEDPNARCAAGTTCIEGICAGAECAGAGDTCTASAECCGNVTCIRGICQTGGPSPGDAGGVTTLPDTGVGGDGDSPDPLLGITLAAGAASWLLRKKSRETPAPMTSKD